VPRWMLYLALACPAWAMLTHFVLAGPTLVIETGMHTAVIPDAAMDRAGHLVVTVSYDKTARVWTLPELRQVAVLRPSIEWGQFGQLYSVAVKPDGTLTAVAGQLAVGNEYAIDLFDLTNDRLVQQFKVPSTVESLAISEDGALLAAGLYGGQVRVWQLADGEVKLADLNYSGTVLGLDFAPDGSLAASSYDGDIRLYDSALHLRRRQPTEAGRQPRKVKFSPDGRDLAIGFDDQPAIEVRSAADLSLRTRPDVSGFTTGNLGVVAWSSDGQEVLAGGTYPNLGIGTISILAWENRGAGARRVVASTLEDNIRSILTLPSSSPLAGDLVVTTVAPSVQVFAADQTQAVQLAAQPSRVADLRPAIDAADPARQLFRISNDGAVVEIDRVQSRGHPVHLDATALTVTQLNAATPDLQSWQPADGSLRPVGWFNGQHPEVNGKPLPLQPSEVSRAVDVRLGRVLLGSDFSLKLLNPDASMAWSNWVSTDIAWRVAQSPDARLAVAALGDGTVRWYRASDGNELLAIFLHADGRRWVAFTPGGYYATSPDGEDLIGWQVNNDPQQAADFFPASRFHDRFYRPDIVAQVLRTLDDGR
jgi:hypothetical protein